MLEDAKVDGLLVWPYAPGDGMFSFNIDPADKI